MLGRIRPIWTGDIVLPGQPPNKVPLIDLVAQYQNIESEILAAIRDVCASQKFVLGPNVLQLEQAIADYCRTDYAVAMSSGTDALIAGLMAFDIGHHDEVITSPFSFFATAGSIARLGARPVFCDIAPDTYNLNPSSLRQTLARLYDRVDGRLINRGTGGQVRAIMPVHLYGQLAEMVSIREIADEYRLEIIEDAAQAIGAEDGARHRAGGFGDIGCLSFFPTKNLGAFGDAGMCTTNDKNLAEKLRVLRVHGGKSRYHHDIIGGNFRLDEIQAAVLRVKLKYLDDWTEARQEHAAFYNKAMAEACPASQVTLPVLPDSSRHIFHQYVIRAKRRDELKEFLAKAGIASEVYYPIPLHLQKCFEYLGHKEGEFPEAEHAARETIALPVYPELAQEQQLHIVETIARFYA